MSSLSPLRLRRLHPPTRAWACSAVCSFALAGAVMGQAPTAGGDPNARRESVKIEPYTGPPIFLPEQEPPPPPQVVETRTIKQNFPETETLRFERQVVILSDNTVVSDGPHREFYSSGDLYVEGEFSRGVAVGEWVYRHENGEVAKKVNFKSGQPEGEVTLFNEDGQAIVKRVYVDGRREGVWEMYSEDGTEKLREESYKNGLVDGVVRIWFPGGQLRQELPFKAGKREGLAVEWDRLGEKRAEITFRDGKKDGPATLWRRDGKVVRNVYEEGQLRSSEEISGAG